MAGVREWLRVLLGGTDKPGADAAPSEAPAPLRESKSFVEGSNDFALALYGHVSQETGNLFLSPFSIRAAFGMAYAGARGDTAAQMGEALRFSASDEAIHAEVTAIVERLAAGGGGRYEMAVANSLWGQDGAPLRNEFLDLVARRYAGSMNLVDFRRAAEAARQTINAWVEEKTKQKIRELISQGGLGADSRLVLVNAVYFKGTWELQFSRAQTHDEPFHLDGGWRVQTPMMHQQVRVRHMQTQGYQAVDLDYRGDDLAMLVLLPDTKDGLGDLEKRLSARMLHDCVAQLADREVKLFIPRFKLSWRTEMGAQLRALGMPLAFSRSEADFSGINGCGPAHEESLFISGVFHQARVDVDEEGTEAAAATAVIMTVSMALLPAPPPPIPIFRADHPFLFAIRDRKSGAIVFLGRMADPTES